MAHEILLEPKPTKQKSCHRCVRSKIKCGRVLPCGSCAASGALESCSYPSSDFAPRTDLRLVDYPSSTRAKAGDSPPPALPWAPGGLGSAGFGLWSAAGGKPAGQAVALWNQGYYGLMVTQSAYTGAQADFRSSGLDWLDFDAPGMGLDGSVVPYAMPVLGPVSADRARAALASSLRGLGVVNPQPGAAEERGPTAGDPVALHAEWTAWASREKGRRIAWASLENDCNMCTLTNQRGGVDLGELPARLPCSGSLWEAP